MDKDYPPDATAPPYPGPPMNYGCAVPQPGYYPAAPPPAGYHSGAPFAPVPAPSVTTVTHVVLTPALQDRPGQTVCPHCNQNVVTKIEHTSGLLTWAICGGLAFFGCFLCCCIPFCIDSFQDVEHRCPCCHRVIYVFKRL